MQNISLCKNNTQDLFLSLLQKYSKLLKTKMDQWSLILIQQRLIYMSLAFHQRTGKIPHNFNITLFINSFVQKVNLKLMSYPDLRFQQKINLISKSIDMLIFDSVKELIPKNYLLKLRILCFNNLSCIYKEQKDLQSALGAITLAVQIEQLLVNIEPSQLKSLASTLINKCTIESEMKNHSSATQTIQKCLSCLNTYSKNLLLQKKLIKGSIEDRQIIGIKLFAFYNMGCQYQYLGLYQRSIHLYHQAYKLAKYLGNQGLKHKVRHTIRSLMRAQNKTQI